MMTYIIYYTTYEGYSMTRTAKVYSEDDLFDWIREIETFDGRVTGYRRIK